jgi:hypothetical protein
VRNWLRRRCEHPDRCRERIFNGAWIVEMCGLCGEIFSMDKPTKGTKMANPLSSITVTEIKADAAKVAEVLALVEKYQGALPLPASVETGLVDFEKALTFGISIVGDL